jgi:hypothetical protein
VLIAAKLGQRRNGFLHDLIPGAQFIALYSGGALLPVASIHGHLSAQQIQRVRISDIKIVGQIAANLRQRRRLRGNDGFAKPKALP